MSTFEELDKVFDIEPTEIIKLSQDLPQSTKQEIQQDYEITRAQLHNLVMKGQESY